MGRRLAPFTESIPMTLGELILTSRTKLGLSQREFADGLCSAGYLSRVEQGKRIPSARLLLELPDKLGVPLSELVEAYIACKPGLTRPGELAVLLTMRGYEGVACRVLSVSEDYLDQSSSTWKRDLVAYFKAASLWHEVYGDLPEAWELTSKRLDIVRDLESKPFAQAEAYLQAGSLAFKLGQFKPAEELLFEAWWAVQRALQSSKRSIARERVSRLLQRVIWWLGFVLLSTRQVEKAWMVYQQGQHLEQLWALDLDRPPTLQVNMSVAALGVGEYQQAVSLLQSLVNETGLSDEDRSLALVNLGVGYRLQGRYEVAKKSLLRAWELCRNHQTGVTYNTISELARLAFLR